MLVRQRLRSPKIENSQGQFGCQIASADKPGTTFLADFYHALGVGNGCPKVSGVTVELCYPVVQAWVTRAQLERHLQAKEGFAVLNLIEVSRFAGALDVE